MVLGWKKGWGFCPGHGFTTGNNQLVSKIGRPGEAVRAAVVAPDAVVLVLHPSGLGIGPVEGVKGPGPGDLVRPRVLAVIHHEDLHLMIGVLEDLEVFHLVGHLEMGLGEPMGVSLGQDLDIEVGNPRHQDGHETHDG